MVELRLELRLELELEVEAEEGELVFHFLGQLPKPKLPARLR